jgi:hypothetical protein
MLHETVNTGYLFLILYARNRTTGAASMYNMVQEAKSPYNVLIALVKSYTNYDFTMVNWAFITEDEYNNLKRTLNENALPWKQSPIQ